MAAIRLRSLAIPATTYPEVALLRAHTGIHEHAWRLTRCTNRPQLRGSMIHQHTSFCVQRTVDILDPIAGRDPRDLSRLHPPLGG